MEACIPLGRSPETEGEIYEPKAVRANQHYLMAIPVHRKEVLEYNKENRSINTPYSTANDAVEFWRECLLVLDDSPGDIPGLTIEAYFASDEDMEAFTRDMLARCVLWLAARGRYVTPAFRPISKGSLVTCELQGYPHPIIDLETTCIFTAHKRAVLAVSGELES